MLLFNLAIGAKSRAFQLEQTLTASDPANNDNFGWSVDLSSDGNTAIIGAYEEDSTPSSGNGAAYVFTRSGSTWTQQQKLIASDFNSFHNFGQSVSLSDDGNTAIVGSPYAGSNYGAAYVFTRTAGVWTEQQKITPSDPTNLSRFGWSVDLSSDGNTAIIGAWGLSSATGASYVFTRSAGVWTEQQKITASDGASGDYFGYSVNLSSDGNTALVGAYRESTSPESQNGAAYVFTRSAGVWTEQQKLTASDALGGDEFGTSVALSDDGNTALIGADNEDTSGYTSNGAAYVFTRSGGVWTQQQKITASAIDNNSRFGYRVALSASGDLAAISAWWEDGVSGGNVTDGAFYIFNRTGGVWTEVRRVLPSVGGNRLGSGIALSSDGGTILVGQYLADNGGRSNDGQALVYTQ